MLSLFKKKLEKVILRTYPNKVWGVAEVIIGDEVVAKINKFYEITETAILIREASGGSGYGYTPGDVIGRVSLEGRELVIERGSY